MPIDFLKNWMEDRIEGSVTEGRRGEYKPGVLESMAGGLLGLDGQAIADDLKVVDDNDFPEPNRISVFSGPEKICSTEPPISLYTTNDVRAGFDLG